MPRLLDPEAAYDAWSATYDDGANPMLVLVQRALEGLLESPPRRALELGCGTGRNLALLARHGVAELTGLDLSSGMLAVASRRVPRARLLQHDITRPLPLDDDRFDLVLVTLVLEHVEDPAPVLREAARVLAPGGRLVVMELHAALLRVGSRASFRDADGEEVQTAAWAHDGATLDDAARASGLVREALDEVVPDPETAARFATKRRRPDVPWLLVGRWRAPAT